MIFLWRKWHFTSQPSLKKPPASVRVRNQSLSSSTFNLWLMKDRSGSYFSNVIWSLILWEKVEKVNSSNCTDTELIIELCLLLSYNDYLHTHPFFCYILDFLNSLSESQRSKQCLWKSFVNLKLTVRYQLARVFAAPHWMCPWAEYFTYLSTAKTISISC